MPLTAQRELAYGALVGWIGMKIRLLAVSIPLLLAACESEAPAPPTAAPTTPESPVTEESPGITEPEVAVVPDVVGLKVTRARQIVRSAGLRPRTSSRPSDEPVRTVLRQRPAAGLEVHPGRAVLLIVAKPLPPLPPPNDYSPPIPPGPDVDCAGGSGDGPRYEGQGGVPFGPFQVIRADIYGLDGDDDGVGCE
jgi:hypothetical protein